MNLYKYIKEKMLQNPYKTLSDDLLSITYKELIDFAENYAKNLTSSKYGIMCSSQVNTVKMIMAVLCARATAVILSEHYGKSHNQKVIDTTNLSYLLCDDEIIKISSIQKELEDLSDVAFIMCTSGTTGAPKGTMITHENIITNLKDIDDYFNIDSNDTIFIPRTLYHCAVLTGELFISLFKNLNVVFGTGEFNPVKTIRIIKKKI